MLTEEEKMNQYVTQRLKERRYHTRIRASEEEFCWTLWIGNVGLRHTKENDAWVDTLFRDFDLRWHGELRTYVIYKLDTGTDKTEALKQRMKELFGENA